MVVNKFVSVIIIVLSLVLLVLCQNSNNATYPIEYKISLKTLMDLEPTFDGVVEIKIGVNIRTDEIRLDAFIQRYYDTKLFVIDGDSQTEIKIDNQILTTNKFILILAQVLVPGKEYTLSINYVGDYQAMRLGLYKSGVSSNGQVTAIATNLIPRASYVFPCYDDPTFTAKFGLTIQHPVGYHATSNMKVLETTTNHTHGMISTIFHVTPILSIHSIAFVVSNFESICSEDDGLEICVHYDEQHTAADIGLVLEVTRNSLVELRSYLGVSLDLPKLDIIPVFDDNNWLRTSGSYGILINNQKYFYFNAATLGLVHKEEIIRHTISQVVSLYFGNMMVPEWWNDIWLTRGLSVLFEYTVADKLYPEFDEMNQFLSALYELGFIEAAVKPIDSDTIDSVILVYNGIEYKSAGILYMLKNIVGNDVFKSGLQSILSDGFRLINSETFFNIFTQLAIEMNMIPSNYDLNIIMNTWLTQLRYPMVSAIRSYLPENLMRIHQQDIINVFGENLRTVNWWIPHTCISQFNSASEWTTTSQSRWLENYYSTQTIDHGLGPRLDVYTWMLCNKEQSGFYYMRYDPNNYRLLANQLYTDHTIIPPVTRGQLVHVGFIAARYQQNEFSLIFELSRYIHREKAYTPLNSFIKHFAKFIDLFYGTEPHENVTKFIAHQIGPAYDRVGPNTDIKTLSFNDEKLRNKVIDMACFSGYEKCLTDMNELLTDAVSRFGINEVIRSLSTNEFGVYIVFYGMALVDENLFWKIIAADSNFNQLAQYLAYAHNSTLLDELFTILAMPNGTKINEIEINIAPLRRAEIFGFLLRNLPALDKTFAILIEKSSTLKELLGDAYRIVVIYLAEATKTQARLDKLREIIELYKTPQETFERELKEAEKNVEWCSTRVKEFRKVLSDILEHIDDEDENGDGGAATISASIFLILSLLFSGKLINNVLN